MGQQDAAEWYCCSPYSRFGFALDCSCLAHLTTPLVSLFLPSFQPKHPERGKQTSELWLLPSLLKLTWAPSLGKPSEPSSRLQTISICHNTFPPVNPLDSDVRIQQLQEAYMTCRRDWEPEGEKQLQAEQIRWQTKEQHRDLRERLRPQSET